MVTNSPLQTSVVVVTSTGFELSPFITTSKDAGWFKTFTVTERVVEQLFFQVNVRTAMSVGQASGLALALASAAGCTVVQYTPNQVKETVTGWGGADKLQVQRMVQVRLGLNSLPQPADAADAAALALCHLAVAPMHQKLIAAGAESIHGRARSRKSA